MQTTDPRLELANSHEIRPDGDFVLYWMTAQRRGRFNFALQHAAEVAEWLHKPLVVFEPLRVGYRWASDRMHRFVIEGMRDNAQSFRRTPVFYYPYVEPRSGDGSDLLFTLAARSCSVVTDLFPCFFLPRMVASVKRRIPARLEVVDGNGIMPLAIAQRSFTVAHSYRRWMQKNVIDALASRPLEDPLAEVELPPLTRPPADILSRWPAAEIETLLLPGGLADLPIDHDVSPAPQTVGGPRAADFLLDRFLNLKIDGYGTERNHPDRDGESGLSPYLHFGHISAHEVVGSVLQREDWTPESVHPVNGKNHGFWNVSEPAEGFLDQMLTWRELSFNHAYENPRTNASLESIPEWAKKTIAETRDDERPFVYSMKEFEAAETHDELWNAAQRQLVQTGVMHNYMRMLWGKKIIHWSESAEDALRIMIHLNNKYALDGRDPNSYCGILWCFGRADRAWGPKRPVFGSLRYMTSDSARKKLQMTKYLRRYSGDQA